MTEMLPCLLLSLGNKKIVLPTAAVAEIIPYRTPESVVDTPSWFVGILTWRGIHIPVINMETIEPFSAWHPMASDHSAENQQEKYIAILNRDQKPFQASGSDLNHQYPFFSVLIHEIPKLHRLFPDGIKLLSREVSEDSRFLMEVKLQNNQAVIPNLQYFWGIIDELPSRLQWFRQIAL